MQHVRTSSTRPEPRPWVRVTLIYGVGFLAVVATIAIVGRVCSDARVVVGAGIGVYLLVQMLAAIARA